MANQNSQTTYLFGPKAIQDALKNGVSITSIYISEAHKMMLQPTELSRLVNEAQIPVVVKDRAFFHQFRHLNHQFMVAQIAPIRLISLETAITKLQLLERGVVLILDRIEDVRNFGSILRSAAAFNCATVFFQARGQAPLNDVAIRMSMGGINYVPLCQVQNLTILLEKLKAIGFWTYATVLDQTAVSLYTETFPNKVSLLVGNEGTGIRSQLQNHADQGLFIPMPGGHIQSLNVGVACGICLSYITEKIKI